MPEIQKLQQKAQALVDELKEAEETAPDGSRLKAEVKSALKHAGRLSHGLSTIQSIIESGE